MFYVVCCARYVVLDSGLRRNDERKKKAGHIGPASVTSNDSRSGRDFFVFRYLHRQADQVIEGTE